MCSGHLSETHELRIEIIFFPIKSKTPSLSAVNLTCTWSSFSCLFSLFSSGFTLLSSVQMLWLKNSADSVRVVLSLTSVSILSCLSLTSFCCNLPAGCLQEQAYNTNDSYELIIFNESLLKTHKSVLDSRVTGSPKNKKNAENVLTLRLLKMLMSLIDLEKCSITSLAQQWILCSEWVPSERESKQLIKTSQ